MADMNSEKIRKITEENQSDGDRVVFEPVAGVISASLQLAQQKPLLLQFKEDVRSVIKDPNIQALDGNVAKEILERLYSAKNPKEFNKHIPFLLKAEGDVHTLVVHAKINAHTSTSLGRLLRAAHYFKDHPLVQYPK